MFTAIQKKIKSIGLSGLSGILLVVVSVAAFGIANSSFAPDYESLWAQPFTIGFSVWGLSKPLILWINDGLMAIFFLLVGLEIKREVISGALSTPRKAALPIFAALGGMIVPAAVYLVVNDGGHVDGWAIPMATDIAFALGILALFGSRIPISLKIFLTALAVVDDLGAILIIAIFFTESISWTAVFVIVSSLVGLFALNRTGVRKNIPYLILGAILWVAVLKSGVHATVAGVLLALFIPASRKLKPEHFYKRLTQMVGKDGDEDGEFAPDNFTHQVRTLCDDQESPLLRWEHALTPYVLLGIMPIFAFANAGVKIAGTTGDFGAVGWGVALGLFIGKPLGVSLGVLIGVRLKFCEIPSTMHLGHIFGAACLAGIGFTMSLFITNLSLSADLAAEAKIGLLAASILSGIVGSIILSRTAKTGEKTVILLPKEKV